MDIYHSGGGINQRNNMTTQVQQLNSSIGQMNNDLAAQLDQLKTTQAGENIERNAMNLYKNLQASNSIKHQYKTFSNVYKELGKRNTPMPEGILREGGLAESVGSFKTLRGDATGKARRVIVGGGGVEGSRLGKPPAVGFSEGVKEFEGTGEGITRRVGGADAPYLDASATTEAVDDIVGGGAEMGFEAKQEARGIYVPIGESGRGVPSRLGLSGADRPTQRTPQPEPEPQFESSVETEGSYAAPESRLSFAAEEQPYLTRADIDLAVSEGTGRTAAQAQKAEEAAATIGGRGSQVATEVSSKIGRAGTALKTMKVPSERAFGAGLRSVGAGLSAGLDIAKDIEAGGIAGDNWASKIGNVANITGSSIEGIAALSAATGFGLPFAAGAELVGAGIALTGALLETIGDTTGGDEVHEEEQRDITSRAGTRTAIQTSGVVAPRTQ